MMVRPFSASASNSLSGAQSSISGSDHLACRAPEQENLLAEGETTQSIADSQLKSKTLPENI